MHTVDIQPVFAVKLLSILICLTFSVWDTFCWFGQCSSVASTCCRAARWRISLHLATDVPVLPAGGPAGPSQTLRCIDVSFSFCHVEIKSTCRMLMTTEGGPVPPSLGGLASSLVSSCPSPDPADLQHVSSFLLTSAGWRLRGQRWSEEGHRTASEVKSPDTFWFICEV